MKRLTLIFIIYFALQGILFITYDAGDVFTHSSDFGPYYYAAKSFLDGNGFMNSDGTPYTWSGPGYPVFIACMMDVFGQYWIQGAILCQALLLALTGYVLHRWVHPWACVILLFNPNSFLAVHALQTETLFTLFLVLYVFLALRSKYALAGLMGGLMALTRPVGFYLLFLFPVMVWLRNRRLSYSW